MARAHLVALAARTPLLAGAQERMFLDIDSLLRPVYGRRTGVFDPAHHQPHGQRAARAQPQGVRGVGDLGIRDQRPGVGSLTAPG
nr:hypothetical protein [Mycobacterium riyadhense]